MTNIKDAQVVHDAKHVPDNDPNAPWCPKCGRHVYVETTFASTDADQIMLVFCANCDELLDEIHL